MPYLSVITPVYNQPREILLELAQRLRDPLSEITDDFEVILVDDGSLPFVWQTLTEISAADPRFTGIRLTRNFGQHVAITAGLDHAKGQWVVVMDADLQDRPEAIPALYAKSREGYEVVFANRAQRPESAAYRAVASLFYYVFNVLAGQEYNRRQGNFSIISSRVVVALRTLREPTRFYGGMLRWIGYEQASITVPHGQSRAPSSYSVRKRVYLALDIIVGFSTRLLYLSVVIGILMATFSLVFGAVIVINKLRDPGYLLPGWPSVITAVFFTAGITNVVVGLLGIYVAQIIRQTRGRPLYFVAEAIDTGNSSLGNERTR